MSLRRRRGISLVGERWEGNMDEKEKKKKKKGGGENAGVSLTFVLIKSKKEHCSRRGSTTLLPCHSFGYRYTDFQSLFFSAVGVNFTYSSFRREKFISDAF